MCQRGRRQQFTDETSGDPPVIVDRNYLPGIWSNAPPQTKKKKIKKEGTLWSMASNSRYPLLR